MSGSDNFYIFAPNVQRRINLLGLASLYEISTYSILNRKVYVGDGLQAYELIRHEALVQSGYTSKNTRGIGRAHYHEEQIGRRHYQLGRNQMRSNLHREIDIGQGALRKARVPKSERKKLCREAKKNYIN